MLTGTECRKTSIDLDQRFREGSFLKKIFWCPGECWLAAKRQLQGCAPRVLVRPRVFARNRIERFFNRIKQCRRVATRYDKLAANYLAFVQLASIRRWLRANESTSEINGCPSCIHVNLSVRASLPVCPDKRTFPRSGRMRRMCAEADSASVLELSSRQIARSMFTMSRVR
jgi:hypothetical protein